MSDDKTLDLGANDIPSWEVILSDSGKVGDSREYANRNLEIYRKADNFKQLTLISATSIPNGVTVEQFVADRYGSEGTTRLKLAQFLLSSLNYIPSNDVLLMLACPRHARAVIATAGAGKTTSLHLDLIVSRMLDTATGIYKLDPVHIEGTTVDVPVILYLNYNKHNVQPIYEKHVALCEMVNSKIQENINSDIESSTVHAFCHKWLQAFSFTVDLPELKIATEEEKQKLWNAVIQPRWVKFYGDTEVGIEWTVLDELYTFKVESMMSWDSFFESAKFVDTELKSEFVQSCIKKYDSLKKSMRLMDFTDYLILMIDILKENSELREQIQDRYKIIVADENQDFTALMNELLLQIYNPKKNRLIVVGDPDQTIYAFKGVSPDNVVNLVRQLEDVEVLGLDTNYRCPDRIVDAAKAILDLNILRFDKPIKTVKTGGMIIKHPMQVASRQSEEVLGILARNGESAYKDTVITYRNNKSSLIIGEELYYGNIPFRMLDDRRPFNNMVFKHIRSALSALDQKDDLDLNRGLYRFLPIPREVWAKILDANAKRRYRHLHDLIMPEGLPAGTLQALSVLVDISMRIDTAPCSDYIGALFSLYRKYYFDFLAKTPNPAIGDTDYYMLLLERCVKFWSRPYTFEYMQQELRERNIDRPNAVTLSTFHGLKGLEFNHVIAVDFNDVVFPNFSGIEQRYSENTAMEEKESENRLCYVLVTRAVEDLHLIYSASDPSVYVSILCGSRSSERANDIQPLNLGGVTIPSDANAAKLNFIQRLTGDRRS